MRTIYKYPIEIEDFQILQVPQDFKILTTAVQNDKACIWAEVETDVPKIDLKIYVFGTGHKIPVEINLNYIGSVLMFDGRGVFHVYWAW